MNVYDKAQHEAIKRFMKDIIDSNPFLMLWEKRERKWVLDQAASLADVISELAKRCNSSHS